MPHNAPMDVGRWFPLGLVPLEAMGAALALPEVRAGRFHSEGCGGFAA